MLRTIFSRFRNYKDLFLVLIWREFSIRYKQTLLGVLWAIIQPLSMMLLFTTVFTFLMPIRITKFPYPLFFFSGLIFWGFFVSSLNYSIGCLKNHYNLITRICFPKETLIFSGIAVALIDMMIAASILIIMMIFYNIPFTINALWAFPLIFLLLLFTTSISMILSVVNVFYKDVGLASNFVIQAWFFATPVMYSIDKAHPLAKTIIFLNPMAFIIENMRRCLLESRGVVLWQYTVILLAVASFFLISYRIFLNAEQKLADVI